MRALALIAHNYLFSINTGNANFYNECIETTDKIITNCLCESKYNHIKILCEYIEYTRKTFNDYF